MQFPYYGNPTTNATIASGGFLYVGPYIHSWLAATQYIAPLMTNLDSSKADESKIIYAYNQDLIVVEWHELVVRGQENVGNFTFQAILHNTGDIDFAYKNVRLC